MRASRIIFKRTHRMRAELICWFALWSRGSSEAVISLVLFLSLLCVCVCVCVCMRVYACVCVCVCVTVYVYASTYTHTHTHARARTHTQSQLRALGADVTYWERLAASVWVPWLIGDACITPQGHRGRVAYLGRCHLGVGLWCGVVLNEPLGSHDGADQGHRYFRCEPKYGVLLPAGGIGGLRECNTRDAIGAAAVPALPYAVAGQPHTLMAPMVAGRVGHRPAEAWAAAADGGD
eukprot:COSAG05_NODE_3536_length_2004_cov_16.926509_1_plen_235_part_00